MPSVEGNLEQIVLAPLTVHVLLHDFFCPCFELRVFVSKFQFPIPEGIPLPRRLKVRNFDTKLCWD